MQLFNYREIRTPLFEETAMFSRSIGELTDIVGKEMYSFIDRSGHRKDSESRIRMPIRALANSGA